METISVAFFCIRFLLTFCVVVLVVNCLMRSLLQFNLFLSLSLKGILPYLMLIKISQITFICPLVIDFKRVVVWCFELEASTCRKARCVFVKSPMLIETVNRFAHSFIAVLIVFVSGTLVVGVALSLDSIHKYIVVQ